MMLVMSGLAVPAVMAMAIRPALAQQTAAGAEAPIDAARHKQMTLAVGTFSKETSQIAMQRAANAKIREFAGFEVAEQTTIAQVLTNLANPPPAPLSGAFTQQMQQLQSASGASFDQLYLQIQIQGHDDLLRIQQEFLRGQHMMSGDAAHVAMLARTVIEMHLTMLHDLAATTHA
jgi:predicted outer membrane protein